MENSEELYANDYKTILSLYDAFLKSVLTSRMKNRNLLSIDDPREGDMSFIFRIGDETGELVDTIVLSIEYIASNNFLFNLLEKHIAKT